VTPCTPDRKKKVSSKNLGVGGRRRRRETGDKCSSFRDDDGGKKQTGAVRNVEIKQVENSGILKKGGDNCGRLVRRRLGKGVGGCWWGKTAGEPQKQAVKKDLKPTRNEVDVYGTGWGLHIKGRGHKKKNQATMEQEVSALETAGGTWEEKKPIMGDTALSRSLQNEGLELNGGKVVE